MVLTIKMNKKKYQYQHIKEVILMTKDDVWRLFMMTGNINYYIKYKKMLEEGVVELGANKD